MIKTAALIIGLALLTAGCEREHESRTIIETPEAPAAIGPYSQAVLTDNRLYLAGQIAIDPATGQFVEGGIEAQTRQVLENINAVLSAAGYDFGDVVQVQIFLTDMNEYATVNSIYSEYFKKEFPARAVVEVRRLPKDALIEILVVAEKDED
jgi:2-iminobutanoate/2-iminopropanoate deaminase